MNRIFNEILYLVTRAQGSEMPWWIVGVGWHWCISFNIMKLLKFVACLIFRVAQLCVPCKLLYPIPFKSSESVLWAGESHQYQVLPEDLQINFRASVVLFVSTAWVLCRRRSLTHTEGCKYWNERVWSLWKKAVSQVLGTRHPQLFYQLSKVLRNLRSRERLVGNA